MSAMSPDTNMRSRSRGASTTSSQSTTYRARRLDQDVPGMEVGVTDHRRAWRRPPVRGELACPPERVCDGIPLVPPRLHQGGRDRVRRRGLVESCGYPLDVCLVPHGEPLAPHHRRELVGRLGVVDLPEQPPELHPLLARQPRLPAGMRIDEWEQHEAERHAGVIGRTTGGRDGGDQMVDTAGREEPRYLDRRRVDGAAEDLEEPSVAAAVQPERPR